MESGCYSLPSGSSVPSSSHEGWRLGFDTVKVSNVEGHATRAMVDSGDVRFEDLVGNNGADAAADLERLRQQDAVITARRDLLRVRRFWYPIILDLHKFMVAISRIEVNHDGFGGTAPDAMVWDKGGVLKTRTPLLSSLIIDRATLPGPPGFWVVLGVPCTHFLLLQMMLLFGPTVLTSFLFFLPFWLLFIGHRVLLIWGSLVFLIWSCFLRFEVFTGHRLLAEKTVRPPAATL